MSNIGVRRDVENHVCLHPGEYGRLPDGRWCCHPPDFWRSGTLELHTVVEHADHSITASPSLLFEPIQTVSQLLPGWHGYLEAGVWRQVP